MPYNIINKHAFPNCKINVIAYIKQSHNKGLMFNNDKLFSLGIDLKETDKEQKRIVISSCIVLLVVSVILETYSSINIMTKSKMHFCTKNLRYAY